MALFATAEQEYEKGCNLMKQKNTLKSAVDAFAKAEDKGFKKCKIEKFQAHCYLLEDYENLEARRTKLEIVCKEMNDCLMDTAFDDNSYKVLLCEVILGYQWNCIKYIERFLRESLFDNSSLFSEAELEKIGCWLLKETPDDLALNIRAAELGMSVGIKYCYDFYTQKNDTKQMTLYLAKILETKTISDQEKYRALSIMRRKYNVICSEENTTKYLGNCYSLIDDKIEEIPYSERLKSTLQLSCVPIEEKAQDLLRLGKLNLIEKYIGENANIPLVEYYRTVVPEITLEYFSEAEKLGNIEAGYYLAIIYGTGLLGNKDPEQAIRYLNSIINHFQNITEQKFKKSDSEWYDRVKNNIFDLHSILISIQESETAKRKASEIIGNAEIKTELERIDKEYAPQLSTWDYSSDFDQFMSRGEDLEYKILVFAGEDSLCKKYSGMLYKNYISNIRMESYDWVELDTTELNTEYFISNKLKRVKDIFYLKNGNLLRSKVVYFDKPYALIGGEGKSNDVIDRVIETAINVSRKENQKGSILILAGEEYKILEILDRIGLADYQYKVIRFHGYSADESLMLMKKDLAKRAISEEVYEKIREIIEYKNTNANRGINYELVKFIEKLIIQSNKREMMLSPSECQDERQKLASKIRKQLNVEFQTMSSLDSVNEELKKLIGLKNLKREIESLKYQTLLSEQRKKMGLKSQDLNMHFVFVGNPGTGKTTVARLFGKMFKELGILEVGHVVEVTRADLVAEYEGQTASKTRSVLERAKNGVLFIDEAYTLSYSNRKDGYGQEVIDELLKYMSDHKSEICVIVAGYPAEMDKFVNSNPGLKSRFQKTIAFQDYDDNELFDIFKKKCSDTDYSIELGVEEYIKKDLANLKCKEGFANARSVESYFDELKAALSEMVIKNHPEIEENPEEVVFTKEEMMTFTKELFSNCSKEDESKPLFF